MELSWPIKIRIGLAAAVGIGLIGMLAWPLVAPAEPFGVVSVVSAMISSRDVVLLLALAFCVGLIAYFLSWPYGGQIGVLAVPAGLAVWAFRSGTMGSLMQLNSSVVSRERLYSTMEWETLLWLGLVVAGYLATHILRHPKPEPDTKLAKRSIVSCVYPVAAIVASAMLVPVFIGIFATDFTLKDLSAGTVIGQPSNAQIGFGVFVAFGVMAFLVKKLLGLDYTWPVIASCLVIPLSLSTYGKSDILADFASRWPAVFFPGSVLAVLPIQIVAFGSLGSIAGYWLAVRYGHSREQEAESN